MISKLQGDYNGSTNGPQGLSSFTRIPVSLSGKKSQLCSYQRCPISSTLPAGHAQTQEVPSSRQCQHRHQAHTDKSTPLLSTAWLNVVWLSSSLFRSLNPLTRAPSPSVKSKAQRHCCWSQSCQVPLAFLLQTGAPCMLGSNRASPELTSPPASCSVLHHNSQVLGLLS